MPNVVVRDLPENVHGELLRRARAAGQSLQQYLTAELSRIAATPSVDDVLARIARRRGGTVGLTRAAKDLATERGRR